MAAAASKAAPPDAADAVVAAPRGKKKVMMMAIIGVSALLLVGGGGAAFYVMKQRAAAAAAAQEEGEDAASAADAKHDAKTAKADLKHAPTFVALDPFTVNLADRDAERYAQVGMTLELVDSKAGDLLKAYMPAIRNNILLALGSKTAAQLAERDDKLRLAEEIRREALRPLGYELAAPAAVAVAASGVKRAAAASPADEAPIRAVHFSNFIVQ
jgi:flagellar FliL protein